MAMYRSSVGYEAKFGRALSPTTNATNTQAATSSIETQTGRAGERGEGLAAQEVQTGGGDFAVKVGDI